MVPAEGENLDERKYYNLEEIFFIAARIEKNGKEFYTYLAEHTLNAPRKKAFALLALEEEKHYELFKELHAKFKKEIPDVSSHLYNDLPSLIATANNHRFITAKPQDVLKNAKNPLDIFDFALGCEDDTIRFFKELCNIVDIRYRDSFVALIAEEKKHIELLRELKAKK